MNPADEVDIEVMTRKALEEYERQIARAPRDNFFRVTFNDIANSTGQSLNSVGLTDEAVLLQTRRKLERIKSYTAQIRNNLRAVEVLDELWDNGTEVAVIPKAALDVLDRLLQEIEAAGKQ